MTENGSFWGEKRACWARQFQFVPLRGEQSGEVHGPGWKENFNTRG